LRDRTDDRELVTVPTVKLVLEYDGACFHGWQKQRELKTVQGELEDKLRVILGEQVRVVGAGRTDAGCHAVAQAASFVTGTRKPPEEIQRALNGLMRGELVVKGIEVVPDGFNARFSARSRRYRYLIAERATALMRDRSWVMARPHDLAAMNDASRALVGRHDFSVFSKRDERAERNPECEVVEAIWARWDLGVSFEIEADRFLRGMVRMIVGTIERVGAGAIPVDSVRGLLEGAVGMRAGPAAPARALYLLDVKY